VLLERIATANRLHPREGDASPLARASKAIANVDTNELQRIAEMHPQLLDPSNYLGSRSANLLSIALDQDRARGHEAVRPIMEWLASRGLDLQRELNLRLCGHTHMEVETVRYLLDRGANPDWVAPNGIPLLEHALLRYWNGEAVDLIAARVRPRKALWIAAGLGDVEGVRRFLDDSGKPTPAAWRLRPDFDAIGGITTMPSLPDPDDDELLMEAFFVAMLNHRTRVLEYMVSRGFDIDSLAWGSPLINIAVGNAWTPVVECLVRCGADLNLRGWRPHQSAREIAREMFRSMSHDASRRRIVELCGMNPDAILAERAAGPGSPPAIDPH
jgi:hypothetical protein